MPCLETYQGTAYTGRSTVVTQLDLTAGKMIRLSTSNKDVAFAVEDSIFSRIMQFGKSECVTRIAGYHTILAMAMHRNEERFVVTIETGNV